MADEHWLKVIDVNLNGTFWCCRAFGRHMLAAGAGAIVNIGSMSGFIVNRPQAQSYYNASKAGGASADQVAGRGMGAARRAGQCGGADLYRDADSTPSSTRTTEMYRRWIGGTPMARLGKVEEVASVVLFLASEAASLMTGSRSCSPMAAIPAGEPSGPGGACLPIRPASAQSDPGDSPAGSPSSAAAGRVQGRFGGAPRQSRARR